MPIKFAGLVVLIVVLSGCAGLPQQSDPSVVQANVAEAEPVAPRKPAEAVPTPPAPPSKKNITASAPPIIAISPASPPADVWERIRIGFAIPDGEDALVQENEAWYGSRPDYMRRIFSRSQRYLFHIVEEVEKRGMPTEIALLPIVESAFNPKAYSRSHASGIWQFIPSTGKHYGLQQNWWYDERRDVLSSTNAALDYLQKLYNQFGSWDLALSAYNWGEGNLSRAIARNFAAGLPTDLSALNLPNETRNYVPRLLAIKRIVLRPENYGLTLNTIPNQPYFTSIQISHHLDLDLAAKFAEMSVDDFIALNPAYNKPVVRAESEKILLPVDKAKIFTQNLTNYKKSLVSWQAYTARRGEKVSKIAKKFNMAFTRFKELNGVSEKQKTKGGEMYLVPLAGNAAPLLPTAPIPEPVSVASAPAKATSYVVKKGDTLYSVAKLHGLSASQLMAHNQLSSTHLFAGQKLSVAGDRATPVVSSRETKKMHYTVRRGDTLSSIARRFSVAVADLQRWNRLSTKEALLPGVKVVIALADQAQSGSSGRSYRRHSR